MQNNNTNHGSSAQQHFDTAVLAQKQGKIEEAVSHYRAVLHLHPDHLGTLQRLAMLLAQADRMDEAADIFERIVALAPNDAIAHANLGQVLNDLERYREALGYLKRAIALKPDSAATHTNLGNVLAKLGRADEALASFNKAVSLNPRLAEPHNNIGNVLASAQRHKEAVAAFERALALRPDFPEAFDNLGNALSALGRHNEAIAAFEAALKLRPDFATAHYNLGTAVAALGRHNEAVKHYEQALTLRPGYPAALNNLGNSLRALRRPAESLAAFERLLALEPNLSYAHLGAGNALQILGRIADARHAFERAVELAPDTAAFHRALAEVKHYELGDPQFAAMSALVKRADSLSVGDQIELHFALAKAYDEVNQAKEAFEHLQKGNSLKRQLIAYDEAAELQGMRDIQAVFTGDIMRARQGLGEPSRVPVFVVGMPRSGTTLIEQILAAHPRVFGAGELLDLLDLVKQGWAGDQFPADFASVSTDRLNALGRDFVARIRNLAPLAGRIVDKLPANFRFIGLIHLALPNARVIHVRRDPLDTCLSCYTKLFPSGLEYTFDLGELGRYYRAYEALMAHWREVLPDGAMLEVQYEDVVADFQAQAHRIVEYCGLEWDARCAAFDRLERPVYTASSAQVRRPLNADSIGRWRRYAGQLEPLLQVLGHNETGAPG